MRQPSAKNLAEQLAKSLDQQEKYVANKLQAEKRKFKEMWASVMCMGQSIADQWQDAIDESGEGSDEVSDEVSDEGSDGEADEESDEEIEQWEDTANEEAAGRVGEQENPSNSKRKRIDVDDDDDSMVSN